MRHFIWLLLIAAATAQIPCPSNEVLTLPNDGMAAAPKSCVNTALPPAGATVSVSDFASLMAALKCGTTAILKPGTYTLNAAGIKFPSCTAGHWFVIRSGGDFLPAPGTRMNPSYAGVSNLLGRPAFTGGTKPSVATFIVTGLAPTAGSYNRIGPGIEIVQADKGGTEYNSILLDARNVSHVVILRNLIHGTAKGQVGHAIMVSGSNHIAISGNYIYDIHCIANGKCSDAQTILGGCGASGAGFLIENNFLEASTEGILFGGCGASSTASDVIIERNHIYKPMSWMEGSPDFIGIRFMVKNGLELKNCLRCLIQQNLIENSWGGFSQNGYSVLFTPKNQVGLAPGAQVSDIIFRGNSLIGGAGMQVAAAKDDPPLRPSSLGVVHMTIRQNLISVDNIKFIASAGLGMQLTLQDNLAQFTDILIDHNSWTASQNSAFMFGAVKAGSLIVTNNIIFPGKYNSTTTGSGTTDCSYQLNTKPAAALTACWTSTVWSNNLVVGGNANWPIGTDISPIYPFLSSIDTHTLIFGRGVDMDALNLGLQGVN